MASGGSTVTSVTLPANTSTVNGYLVDYVAGSPFITASVAGGVPSSGTQAETINAGVGTQLAITSAELIFAHSSTRHAFTITLEDANGNATTSAAAITVNLSDLPTTGSTFYASTFGGSVTSVTLPANTPSVVAYFRQTTAGTPTITVAATGLTSGSQPESFS